MRAPAHLLLVLPLLAAACGGDETLYINDNIDVTFDFGLTKPDVETSLHTPYVIGATVRISIDSSDSDADFRNWTVVSEDPSLFSIENVDAQPGFVTAYTTARAAGKTQIVVYDANHHERGRGHVEVGVPDQIRLDAHGWMIIDRDAESPVGEARIVENGIATYLVRYFQGTRELRGNGVLSVVSSDDTILAAPRQSFLFEDREWLTLKAAGAGESVLMLQAAGLPINPVTVVTVPASEVDRVEIHGKDESAASEDDKLVALAQAYDLQDRRIFGVDYTWTVDAVAEFGEGDLYRYQFKPGRPVVLAASDGTHVAEASLHVGEGYVGSSNSVGCAIAAPGRTRGLGTGLGLAGLAALALVFGTRRTRRARA